MDILEVPNEIYFFTDAIFCTNPSRPRAAG